MNRVVIASVVGLLMVALLAAGVYFYQRYSIILLDPMRAVPADAAVILEVKKPAESLAGFFSAAGSSSAWMKEGWWGASAEEVRKIDSLLKENGDVEEIWDEYPLVVSTHLVKAGRFEYLYLTNLPRGWTEKKLKSFIEEHWLPGAGFERHEYENVNIYETHLQDTLTFSFASDKSVAIFSFSPVLIEQAIRQLKQGSGITQSKHFRKIIPGQEPGINLYLNNQSLRDIALSISSGENQFFSQVSSFARWSGFRVLASNNFLMLDGKTATFDTTDYLAFFRNQKPQKLQAPGQAPSRTALLYSCGFSSFREYYTHLSANNSFTLSRTEREKILNNLDKKSGFSIEDAFTSWVGNEMALVITEPAGPEIENNVFACVRAVNPDEALNQLSRVSAAYEGQSVIRPRLEKYRDHPLLSIPVSGILPLIYGKLFSQLQGCYYTSIDDWIIFSNHPSSIKTWIDSKLDQKTLLQDSLYLQASADRLNECNAYLYVSPEKSINLYRPVKMNSFLPVIYLASGIHGGWVYRQSTVESSFIFDLNSRTMREPVLLWAVQLDTLLSTPPLVLKEKGRDCIFFQDEKNTLYLLNGSGSLLWKKEFPDKIVSSAHAVELYRDGRQQILFNTEKQMFLMDTEGNPVGNYPIRLPAAATNGCTVLPAPSGFQIFIACANRYIYSYEGSGKPATDWNYVRTESPLEKTIQSFSFQRSNYLIVQESDGAITVLDRKGLALSAFREKFTQSQNGKCYAYETDSSGNVSWVTTDTTGDIMTCSVIGSVLNTATQGFSTTHEFFYQKPGITEPEAIVYLDAGVVSCVDLEGNLQWTKKDRRFVSSLTQLEIPGAWGVIVASPADDIFFVLNSKGETVKGFPLKGSIHPTPAGLISPVILCGNRDGILYCYKTE